MSFAKYKLIGFDMDGTLCHPKTKFEDIFATAFGKNLHDVQDVWMKAIMAEGARTGITAIQAMFPNYSQAEAEEYLQNFSTLWAQQQVLFDGALPMLQRLKADGHRLTLITNGPSTMQHAVIDHLGIRQYFDQAFATGDEAIGINKPNRGCFDKVASIFKVEPKDCLFIGDGKINDYQGATGAGWNGLWVNPTNDLNAQAFDKIDPSTVQNTVYSIKWA